MHTNGGTHHLREYEAVRMQIALAGIDTEREPTPQYRVFYRINILNHRQRSVRLMGRKWVLTDTTGDTRIIEAARLFNEEPVLAPGEVFSWSGSQVFRRYPVRMELRLFGTDHAGHAFITPALNVPL